MLNSTTSQKGVAVLMTVLIITAVILMVGVGLALSSINEMKMSLQKSQSSQAYYLANLCGEKALMALKENSAYLGQTLSDIEEGDCLISVEGSEPWTVKVAASFSNQTKKIRIVVNQINPIMDIGSWQQVADF